MEQDAATAEEAILTLLLRIYVRETCFFPKLSEEGGVQCGVWETSAEQPVGDDG